LRPRTHHRVNAESPFAVLHGACPHAHELHPVNDVLMSAMAAGCRRRTVLDRSRGSSFTAAANCELEENMAATCQVTGAVPGFGHNVSHSNRRTKRRFDPNIQKKRYYVPSLRKNITLNVSAKGIKVIDVRGIDAVVADLISKGVKL
jgi:large subunit ribosomal protein L28